MSSSMSGGGGTEAESTHQNRKTYMSEFDANFINN